MARRELAPREDRQIFDLPLTIRDEHIDENGHVNNVVYVGWLQEAGTAHWNSLFSAVDRARWSWVALRHEVDYFRPLPPGATAVARTWVGDPQGPRFNRYVRIEDGEGRLCAQGLSEWCLVDSSTMRPHRIPPEMVKPFEA